MSSVFDTTRCNLPNIERKVIGPFAGCDIPRALPTVVDCVDFDLPIPFGFPNLFDPTGGGGFPGPQGPQGAPGNPGPQGPQGPQGADGRPPWETNPGEGPEIDIPICFKNSSGTLNEIEYQTWRLPLGAEFLGTYCAPVTNECCDNSSSSSAPCLTDCVNRLVDTPCCSDVPECLCLKMSFTPGGSPYYFAVLRWMGSCKNANNPNKHLWEGTITLSGVEYKVNLYCSGARWKLSVGGVLATSLTTDTCVPFELVFNSINVGGANWIPSINVTQPNACGTGGGGGGDCVHFPACVNMTISPNCSPGYPDGFNVMPSQVNGQTIYLHGGTTSCVDGGDGDGFGVTMYCQNGTWWVTVGTTRTPGPPIELNVTSLNPLQGTVTFTGDCCDGATQTLLIQENCS